MNIKITPMVILFFFSPCIAQIDSTLKEFFPLHIGDYWEYANNDFPTPFAYNSQIVGIAEKPNGKIYFAFKEKQLSPFPSNWDTVYYRLDDSLNVFRFNRDTSRCVNMESIVFKLNAPDKTLWETCLDYDYRTQDYIGLYSTFQDYYPYIALDTLTKYYMGAVLDTINGDTLWNASFIFGSVQTWLAQGIGVIRVHGEANSPMELQGAIIDGKQYGVVTTIKDFSTPANRPQEFSLQQNYPDPFNPLTTINYQLTVDNFVSLAVYDLTGKEVVTLVHQHQPAGEYKVAWNAEAAASGIYFCKLQAGKFSEVKKMVLIK